MKRFCISIPEELAKQLAVLRVVDKVETDNKIIAEITKITSKLCMDKNITISLRGVCKSCGAELIERNSKFGKFYGCSKHPKCKYTENIKA